MNKQTNKCNNTANYTEFIAIEIALTSATHTHSQLGNLILSMSIGPKATTEHKFVCSLWLLCYCFQRSISIFNLFFSRLFGWMCMRIVRQVDLHTIPRSFFDAEYVEICLTTLFFCPFLSTTPPPLFLSSSISSYLPHLLLLLFSLSNDIITETF